jgi:predicted RNA binding protein YcfA (HicA-like mRNA interferase family)
MKSFSGKDLAKLLWQLLRIRGSHHIHGRPNRIVGLSIPVHGNKPLKTALLSHLLKMAGIDEELAQ